MAKGLINNSTLTDIANAIRAKMGTSDVMLPSEMAALIEGISEGGKFTYGSISQSNVTNIVTITHDLGDIPNFFALIQSANTGQSSYCISQILLPDSTVKLCYYSGTIQSMFSSSTSTYFYNISDSSITINTPASIRFTYYWVAGVV